MKEIEKMTYAELDALSKSLEEEKEKRKKLAKETYNDRHEALNKVKVAFDEYYDTFHELPFVKYGAYEPIQMEMVSSANYTFEHPYLFFYR